MEVSDKPQKISPFNSQGEAEGRWQRRMRRGKGGEEEEEKTTATELCRGFNQPNYSLITETLNLEQLACSHTHKVTHPLPHTHMHMQLLANHSSDSILQMRWKLQCQTDYFNSRKKGRKDEYLRRERAVSE